MKTFFLTLLISLSLFSCRVEEHEPVYTASNIHRIPYGETGTLAAGNYTGKGVVTNAAGTTVIIEGVTTIDALSILGKVIIPRGAVLIANNLVNVGGGSSIDVKGTLITQTFTQIGNTYVSGGYVEVNGKLTIGGGTTLYLESSQVEVDELVITGNIQAIDNLVTQAANWYSLIELTGGKLLHRGGGIKICGPVLFNSNVDNGVAEETLVNVTEASITNNEFVQTVYGLASSDSLYQYNDNCEGLALMPAH